MSNIDKQALRESAEKATPGEWKRMMRNSDELMTTFMLAMLDELEAKDKRIAELEAKLDSADKLQDSAFRHGLQHGFSLGQTDNQAGFEECLSSYGTGKGE